MSRAELRRKQREEAKKTKTYTLTAYELEQLEQRIRKEEQQKAKKLVMERVNDIAEQIQTMMLVIPTNVLIADYWKKSAEKRIPKFVEDCINLYEAFLQGTVKMSEMAKLTEDYAGIKLIYDEQMYMFSEKVGEHGKE